MITPQQTPVTTILDHCVLDGLLGLSQVGFDCRADGGGDETVALGVRCW
jgi:hypothetical protein